MEEFKEPTEKKTALVMSPPDLPTRLPFSCSTTVEEPGLVLQILCHNLAMSFTLQHSQHAGLKVILITFQI